MKVLVTGAASGLGKQISMALTADGHTVFDFDRSINLYMDVANVTTEVLTGFFKVTEIDALINCAGINLNEWFTEVTKSSFYKVMNVNAWGMVNMVQAAIPLMAKSEVKCVINIVSNAAHMPMTSSLAYNASKAAALMITKQMAHELSKTHGMHILSVSPNKLSGTGMSEFIDREAARVRGWTEEYAREYQKKALMHGRETDPRWCARFVADVLTKGHYKFLTGVDLEYGK